MSVNENEIAKSIKSLRVYIDHRESKYKIPDIMLRRSLNETWFSDTLSWLLDPKSSDSLGVKFIERFVKIISQKRSKSELGYKQKISHLRSGKSGKGRLTTGANRFSLKNAAVCREFYLSKKLWRKSKGPQFCDIVVFDLDSSDGIFLAIENKLFTTNHPNQLEDYYINIEEKYKLIKVREYVYLTILGEKPITTFKKSDKKILNSEWVCISWVDDILPILELLEPSNIETSEAEDVRRVTELLRWLKEIIPKDRIKKDIETFVKLIVGSAAQCLTEELNRLTKVGRWNQKGKTKSSITHTSYPTKVLRIKMISNLFLTVHGQKKSKQNYEKVLIPFSAYPDQVLHLIDDAARNICDNHFNEPKKFKSGKRKRTVTISKAKERIKPLLEFMFENKYQLQVLLSLSKKVKKDDKFEKEYE